LARTVKYESRNLAGLPTENVKFTGCRHRSGARLCRDLCERGGNATDTNEAPKGTGQRDEVS
jgi:hypothetical protein